MSGRPFSFRLPATSANLGPGFDTAGLAMALYLDVNAEEAMTFSMAATGRDQEICGQLENNLILLTYSNVLEQQGRPVKPIRLLLENQIPLGMGCGSSAAALLAGVLLANHFGDLDWRPQQIVDEAARREGHPDNVAACFFGGFTVSRFAADGTTVAATVGSGLPWHLTLALPRTQLATAKARGLLPAMYTRSDVIQNIGSSALLVAAFASGQGALLRTAMEDRVHQPYRSEACPLLPRLLPLARRPDVWGVALSGAGPAVLVISPAAASQELLGSIQEMSGEELGSMLKTTISGGLTLSG